MLIDQQIPKILSLIKEANQIAISSDPGSGKSTRIPPALVQSGYRVLVLEPRRISAISLADYISFNLQEPVGNTVGYQVRGDTKKSTKTKALFATEAMLAKYLEKDPLLSGWDIVILDEFHERHIHTDVAWALLNQIQTHLRPELKIILLSATLNLSEINKKWPKSKTIHIQNPPHPLTIKHLSAPKALSDFSSVAQSLMTALNDPDLVGDVLVFLPGQREISQARSAIVNHPKVSKSHVVYELFGSQSLQDQKLALKKSSKPKIILATNVAESSITIDGVQTVIDSGLERISWSNSKSGLTELKTKRISKSSATQRAGRAARQAPGLCIRLWTEHEQSALEEHSVAEIHRSDLSEPLYTILKSGWDPKSASFMWFEEPHSQKISDGFQKLRDLKIVDLSNHLIENHPRASEYPIGLRGALYLETLLKSKHYTLSGIDLTIASWIAAPEGRSPKDPSYLRDVESLKVFLSLKELRIPSEVSTITLNEHQESALAASIPDRIFEKRSSSSNLVKLSSGRGAKLNHHNPHSQSSYGFALILREADPDVLIETYAECSKAIYQSCLTKEKDSETQTIVSGAELFWSNPSNELKQFLARAQCYKKWCDNSFEIKPLLNQALDYLLAEQKNQNKIPEFREIIAITQGLCLPHIWKHFNSECPEFWTLPKSQKQAPLIYASEDRVELHARLQEFLGVSTHPKIAQNQLPITLVLLSPARRPIQITQRLEDFWTGSYTQIKKEMKARYPKHDW